MIIKYDQLGEPTVYVNTAGGYAVVPNPGADGIIDWGVIKYEPRMRTIKSAWEEFVEQSNPDLDTESPSYLFRKRLDLAELPAVEPPTPDWDTFNGYMLSDATFKGYRDTVKAIDGDLTPALFNAYTLVATNGVGAFSLVWNAWTMLSSITPEDQEAIAVVAEGCNLPADFVSIIRG